MSRPASGRGGSSLVASLSTGPAEAAGVAPGDGGLDLAALLLDGRNSRVKLRTLPPSLRDAHAFTRKLEFSCDPVTGQGWAPFPSPLQSPVPPTISVPRMCCSSSGTCPPAGARGAEQGWAGVRAAPAARPEGLACCWL